MLSLLGDNPDFFVARGNTTGQVLIYAFALAFVPPLLGLAIEALARVFSDDLRWDIHLFLMTVVTGAFFLTISKKWVYWPAGVLVAISGILRHRARDWRPASARTPAETRLPQRAAAKGWAGGRPR